MAQDEWLPRNSPVTAVSRQRFDVLLRDWLARARRGSTVGEVGSYGGKAWLWVDDGDGEYHLNADSDTFGVASYLSYLDSFSEHPWVVVENRRGRKNKVVFGPNQIPLSGFHLYLDDGI